MKKYLKPEIKINEFENNNVISTSCTCPTNCFHAANICAPLEAQSYPQSFYHHNGDFLSYRPDEWTGDYTSNYPTPAGTCEEHGDYYLASKKA